VKAPAIGANAVDTFGREERALRWMRIQFQLAELEGRTPEEVLLADPRNGEVDAIPTRIDYGVYS
jgi:uncharacterized protein (DUF2384 family)